VKRWQVFSESGPTLARSRVLGSIAGIRHSYRAALSGNIVSYSGLLDRANSRRACMVVAAIREFKVAGAAVPNPPQRQWRWQPFNAPLFQNHRSPSHSPADSSPFPSH
jgi:hypothetical protein